MKDENNDVLIAIIQKIKECYYKKTDDEIQKSITWMHHYGHHNEVQVKLSKNVTVYVRKLGFIPPIKFFNWMPFTRRTYMRITQNIVGSQEIYGDSELDDIVDTLYNLSIKIRDDNAKRHQDRLNNFLLEDLKDET